MKSMKNYFGKKMALAVALFGTAIGYAQTPVVQVPPACVVVVAGTGGSLGAGGKVGNGGIVTMPDPYSGDIFTFLPNNGGGVTNTVGAWRLLGDLSDINNSTSSDAPVQPAGTPLAAKIKSYNKKSRYAESAGTSNIAWARSKGRVIISYSNNNGCGNSLTFDVFKVYAPLPNAASPTNLPKIIGPDCMLPNTEYTYSVDQIASDNAGDAIGFDSYYWTVPASFVNSYYSADRSSITFTTGSSIPSPVTLRVDYGRANPWDGDASSTHTTYVTKVIGATPTSPTLSPALTEASPNCLPTGTSSYTVTITPIAGYAYVWTSSNNTWNLAQSGTQNSVLTITNLDNNPGVLTLTVSNGACTPATFNYTLNRTLMPSLGITAVGGGTAATCINSATSYSLPQNALANLTTWSISPIVAGGPTVVNGSGSGSTCTVTPGTASGQFTLIATAKPATTCTSNNTSLIINIRPATPAFTSTSPTCVAKSSSPTVTNLAVDTSAPGTPTTGYVWDLSAAPGWSISSGAGTSNPTFIPNGTTAGPVTISVYLPGTGGCNSLSVSRVITYITVTTNTLNPGAGGCDQYSVNSCGGTVTWFVGGVQAVSNGTTVNVFGNTLTLCGSTAPGSVCANVTINSVTYVACATTLGTHGLRTASPIVKGDSKAVIEGVMVYPNPNQGSFVVKVDTLEKEGQAILTDMSGKQIGKYNLKKGENQIQASGVSKGTYLVVLTVDGRQETRQIIIQ